jgi:SAM-dependent methyltransferase
MENNLKEEKKWFEEWFDSKFYHVLYKDRDDTDAKKFIDNLLEYLEPKKNAIFCDVACGKGRHSIYINKLGYKVDGFDLSSNSIKHAKKFELENLHFFKNDIREPLKINTYDFAFNLFTSFGYFEDESDNQKSIDAIATSLKSNGFLVLDFMNCAKVLKNLTISESKNVDDIKFNINRGEIDGHIVKNIHFKDKGADYNFKEKVKIISLKVFKSYFDVADLKIEAIFGDYNLNPYDINNSDRLILLAKKK